MDRKEAGNVGVVFRREQIQTAAKQRRAVEVHNSKKKRGAQVKWVKRGITETRDSTTQPVNLRGSESQVRPRSPTRSDTLQGRCTGARGREPPPRA